MIFGRLSMKCSSRSSRDLLTFHPQELPRGPGADDAKDRSGTLMGTLVTDLGGIHRGDTLSQTRPDQIVLGLDDLQRTGARRTCSLPPLVRMKSQ